MYSLIKFYYTRKKILLVFKQISTLHTRLELENSLKVDDRNSITKFS